MDPLIAMKYILSFQTHVSKTSTIASHCINHALSDEKNKEFYEKCAHTHSDRCNSCDELHAVLKLFEIKVIILPLIIQSD